MANDDNGFWYRLEQKLQPQPEEEDELQNISVKPEVSVTPPAEPIASYFNDKLLTLRQNIDQINDELVSRRRLLDRSQDDIDYQITKSASSLDQLIFRIGYNRSIDQKRNFLERELANLRRERRATRLRFWEDVVQLRHELREVNCVLHAKFRSEITSTSRITTRFYPFFLS